MEEVKNEMVEQAKAITEVALEQVIEATYDKSFELIVEEIKKAIPGQVDDAVLAVIAPAIKPKVKELVLAQVEKISDKV